MKNFIDTIGNRTRDLPACGAVPQPNVPPGAPQIYLHFLKFLTNRRSTGRSEARSLYALHILCLVSLSTYIDVI